MDFKAIIKILPIPVILSLLGLTKAYLYYSEFGLNIIPYLDISEMLFSFLTDGNIIFISILLCLFHGLFAFNLINKLDIKEDAFIAAIYKHKWSALIWSVIFLVLFCFVMIYFDCYLISYFAAYSAVTAIFFLLIILFSKIDLKILVEISLIIGSLFLVYLLNKNDIRNTKNNAKYLTYCISTENEKLKTDCNYIHIGKTKNYTILYNNSLYKVDMITNSSIKKLSIEAKYCDTN